MPKEIISELSNEQELMIRAYQEKWHSISLSTKPIDRKKVERVIQNTYQIINYPKPDILFYDSPLMAIKASLKNKKFKSCFGRDIHIKLIKRLSDHLQHIIRRQLDFQLFIKLINKINRFEDSSELKNEESHITYFPYDFKRCIEYQLHEDIEEESASNIFYFTKALYRPLDSIRKGCFLDFCISTLGLQHDRKKWKIYQELTQSSGILFLFENVCLACDRPRKLSFNAENMLHAEGEAALEFRDGYGVYACQGRPLNEV